MKVDLSVQELKDLSWAIPQAIQRERQNKVSPDSPELLARYSKLDDKFINALKDAQGFDEDEIGLIFHSIHTAIHSIQEFLAKWDSPRTGIEMLQLVHDKKIQLAKYHRLIEKIQNM